MHTDRPDQINPNFLSFFSKHDYIPRQILLPSHLHSFHCPQTSSEALLHYHLKFYLWERHKIQILTNKSDPMCVALSAVWDPLSAFDAHTLPPIAKPTDSIIFSCPSGGNSCLSKITPSNVVKDNYCVNIAYSNYILNKDSFIPHKEKRRNIYSRSFCHIRKASHCFSRVGIMQSSICFMVIGYVAGVVRVIRKANRFEK